MTAAGATLAPRTRRLLADRARMDELRRSGAIDFTCQGEPPDTYSVRFTAASLAPGDGGEPVPIRDHEVQLYCHLEYPRRPPIVKWKTPIFHPNILSPERGGTVCLGPWSASEGLADVCTRLVDMAGHDLINAADALDREAALWFAERAASRGADARGKAWT